MSLQHVSENTMSDSDVTYNTRAEMKSQELPPHHHPHPPPSSSLFHQYASQFPPA